MFSSNLGIEKFKSDLIVTPPMSAKRPHEEGEEEEKDGKRQRQQSNFKSRCGQLCV